MAIGFKEIQVTVYNETFEQENFHSFHRFH